MLEILNSSVVGKWKLGKCGSSHFYYIYSTYSYYYEFEMLNIPTSSLVLC